MVWRMTPARRATSAAEMPRARRSSARRLSTFARLVVMSFKSDIVVYTLPHFGLPRGRGRLGARRTGGVVRYGARSRRPYSCGRGGGSAGAADGSAVRIGDRRERGVSL